MKNKKGFTLIEIIVTISLLSILGVTIGINLNKIFKSNDMKNYEEYVNKIKDAGLLYVNNKAEIINDLNNNSSFKLIEIGDLKEEGYISDTLKNPDTNEKPKDDEKIKVWLSEDNELEIEYPYTVKEENYLYVQDYKINSGSSENDLCYVGLNTSILQLTNDAANGAKVHDLVVNKSIVAYMEDGNKCSNLKSDKVGTYKIKYVYTTDASDIAEENPNVREAIRTIIVSQGKPIINKYEIIRNTNEVYKPQIKYNVSDSSNRNDMKMKYCISLTDNIKDCTTWENVPSLNNDITKEVDLTMLDSNITSKSSVNIYLYVKNVFEEYTSKNVEYKLAVKVKLNTNGGSYSLGIYEWNVVVGSKINTFINESKLTRNGYVLRYYDGSDGKTYTSSSEINKAITLTANWYKICSQTEFDASDSYCSASCDYGYYMYKKADSVTGQHCGYSKSGNTCYSGTTCTTTTTKSSSGSGSYNCWFGGGCSDSSCCKSSYSGSAWYSSSGWKGAGCYITVSESSQCSWYGASAY